MKTWITSDLHFHHANIMKYCPDSRGHYTSVPEMNRAIIADWQHRVAPDDAVYHLGDFAFGREEDCLSILRQLPGNIHFIRGNHDKNLSRTFDRAKRDGWSIRDYAEVTVSGHKVILFHFPIESWNKMHHGSLHFHGHCHGSLPAKGRRLDVGWDSLGQIADMEDLVRIVARKEIVLAGDHHDGKRD